MIEKESKDISRTAVIFAAIASVVFTLALYIGFAALFSYIDSTSANESTRAWMTVAVFGILFMAPTLAVILIVLPILRRANKK